MRCCSHSGTRRCGSGWCSGAARRIARRASPSPSRRLSSSVGAVERLSRATGATCGTRCGMRIKSAPRSSSTCHVSAERSRRPSEAHWGAAPPRARRRRRAPRRRPLKMSRGRRKPLSERCSIAALRLVAPSPSGGRRRSSGCRRCVRRLLPLGSVPIQAAPAF